MTGKHGRQVENAGYRVLSVTPLSVRETWLPFTPQSPEWCIGKKKVVSADMVLLEGAELRERVARFRRRTEDWALCNLCRGDAYFLTLTFAGDMEEAHDRELMLRRAQEYFKRLSRRAREWGHKDFAYRYVPEKGKRSTRRWHVHALLVNPPVKSEWSEEWDVAVSKVKKDWSGRPRRFVTGEFKNELSELWGNGFIDVCPIRKGAEEVRAAARYLSDYASKAGNMNIKNRRVAFTSIGSRFPIKYSLTECGEERLTEVVGIIRQCVDKILKWNKKWSYVKYYEGDSEKHPALCVDVFDVVDVAENFSLPPPVAPLVAGQL